MERFTDILSKKIEFAFLDRKSAFRLAAFQGDEGISEPFCYTLQLVRDDFHDDLDEFIGLPAMLLFRSDQGAVQRIVHGLVGAIDQGDTGRRFTHYQLRLVSWLYLLTLRRNCRVYQDMEVSEVVTAVFDAAAIPRDHYQFHLSRTYDKRSCCVQYRESDYDFIARLLEHEGIFYYFEHGIKGHVMILGDDAAVHKTVPHSPTLTYSASTGTDAGDDDNVFPFASGHVLQADTVVLRDYNFMKPRLNQEVRESGDRHQEGKLEFFDYPGDYTLPEAGHRYARLRVQELARRSHVLHGGSKCRNLAAGYRFTLERHPRSDFNVDYVVSGVHVEATQPHVLEADAPVAPATYTSNFNCLPARQTCVPLRRTPKPRIDGVQTAIVTGPAGEEIYTDEYGRIKIQFHWDRQGGFDEHSSAWVRVAQSWAGARWGALFLPRVDQEVLVVFEEGDPDRPLVTGTLYHGLHKPPYPLPQHKTRATLGSRSTPDGEGGNEISLEDKHGEEHLIVHAFRDYSLRAEQHVREYVGKDRHLSVGGDQLEAVGADKHQTVGGDQVTQINGTYSLQVDGELQMRIGDDIAVQGAGEVHVAAGGQCVIEAHTDITLKAGGNFIRIGAGGITIVGNLVLINSGGNAGSGKGVSTETARQPEEALPSGSAPAARSNRTPPATGAGPQAQVLHQAARDGTPLVNKCQPAPQGKAP